MYKLSQAMAIAATSAFVVLTPKFVSVIISYDYLKFQKKPYV
ncbi:hypothetical protein [Nostoc sp. FACHB-280]|nr:hypothetical protein [Nostoc sp. FACHB-280]